MSMTERKLAFADVLKKLNGIQRFSDMLLGMEHIVEDMSDNALFIDDMG